MTETTDETENIGSGEPVYNLRLLTSEDSRILRIWTHKQILKDQRIVTKHNDVITRVMKIPGKHLIVTAAADGSVKCFVGKRSTGVPLSVRDLLV